jgi:hypothetical protein
VKPQVYHARFRAGIFKGVRTSKIGGNQVIRTPASADIDLGCGSTYQVTIGIERVQKTPFVAQRIWLNSRQCIFIYVKRRLYCTIVTPKSYSAPR